jgi:DNA modification methylase
MIFNENCLVTMYRMADESVDCIITSPPYDGLRDYSGVPFDFDMIAAEISRVLKPGGVLVWVVGDATVDGSESLTSFSQAICFAVTHKLNLHDTMIYQKDNPAPVGGSNRYYQHFEYMFVLSKGRPKTFNPIIEERRNKHNDKRTHRVKSFVRNKDGSFPAPKYVELKQQVKRGNIWRYVVGGGNSVPVGVKCPAAFPQKLAEDHIKSWTNVGDVVYDPMSGSGTVVKAAELLGRIGIGSELVKEYYCG